MVVVAGKTGARLLEGEVESIQHEIPSDRPAVAVVTLRPQVGIIPHPGRGPFALRRPNRDRRTEARLL